MRGKILLGVFPFITLSVMENLKRLAAQFFKPIDQFMTKWAERLNDRMDEKLERREASENQRLR